MCVWWDGHCPLDLRQVSLVWRRNPDTGGSSPEAENLTGMTHAKPGVSSSAVGGACGRVPRRRDHHEVALRAVGLILQRD